VVHGELQQIRDAVAGAPDLEAMLGNPEIDFSQLEASAS